MHPSATASIWPGPQLASRFVARAVASWLFIRVLVGVTPGLVLPTAIVLVATAGIAAVDARRRQLPLFLSNLGMQPAAILLYWLVPVLLLEIPVLAGYLPQMTGLLALAAG